MLAHPLLKIIKKVIGAIFCGTGILPVIGASGSKERIITGKMPVPQTNALTL
jgi:hypothetical protein